MTSPTRQSGRAGSCSRRTVFLAILPVMAALVFGTDLATAGQVPDPSAETIVLRRCVVEYEQNALVGTSVYGVLRECLVAAGDPVKAGQVLGRLEDGEARAEVALREVEASSDVDARLSEARKDLALAKLQRTDALVRRHAASQEEFLQHKQEAAAAAIEVELAKHRRRIAAIQLVHARATLQTRSLVSPHDGVVAAVLKRSGEPIAPRDPVFQVVGLNELRVVGQLDVSDAWRARVGQPARVVAEVAGADLPVERESFAGKVVFIDSQVDPLTRTCKVHVRASNRDGLLRAGLEARVEIDPHPAVTGRPPELSPGERKADPRVSVGIRATRPPTPPPR